MITIQPRHVYGDRGQTSRSRLLPPPLQAPKPLSPPIRPRARPPAGSGRLCDGCTAAPNLQRRQWGAFVAAIPKPTAVYPNLALPLAGPWGDGLFFPPVLRGSGVPVHLVPEVSLSLSCCSRPGDAVLDDAHTHTYTQTQAHERHTHTCVEPSLYSRTGKHVQTHNNSVRTLSHTRMQHTHTNMQ